MLKYLLVLLIICSSVGSLTAQIKGIVLNDKGEPLELANVSVKKHTDKSTFTDKNGKFTINDIEYGSYTLEVSFIGYKTKELKYEYTKESKEIKVILETKTSTLDEVEIITRPLQPYNYVQLMILKSDIEENTAHDMGDYLRTLNNVSGVRKGGSGVDPVIRGFKFHQLNVRVDGGIRIEGGCPNRMDPTASHIPVDDVEKVEIIKGPYAVKFGLPFGGYIHFITSKPEPFETKKFEMKAKIVKGWESNWNGHREHITLKGGNNKYFFNITGNRMDYGNYSDGNGNVVPSKFNKYAFATEFGFKPKKNQTLLFSYNEHHNRNNYFPALPMDERIDDTRLYAINYMAKMVSPKIKMIKAKLFRTEVFHEMDNKERPFGDTTISISIVDAITQGVGAGIGLKIGKKSTLMIGAGVENTYKNGNRRKVYYGQYPDPLTNQVPEDYENLMDANITNAGSFLELTCPFTNFDLAAAIRFDYNMARSNDSLQIINNNISYYDYQNSSTNFFNVSFSVGVDKKWNKALSTGLSIGRGVRSPNMIERYMKFLPVGYDNFDYLGNPQILPEANHEVDLSFKYNKLKFGIIEFTVFYAVIQDYINTVVVPPSVVKPNSADVIGVKTFVNTNYAFYKGFEVSYASPDFNNFSFNLTAGYTEGRLSEAYGYETDISGLPTNSVIINDDAIAEIPPFEGIINLKYVAFKGKLIPKMSWRFVAAQNNTSLAYNELSTPAFNIMDVGFRYNFNENIFISTGIDNLFDKAYYEHLNRRIIGANNCETCRGINIYEPGRVFYINLIINIR